MCLSQFLIWAKLKKNLDPFQKILVDIEKIPLPYTNISFNLEWSLLHPKCHFNPWWKETDMTDSPDSCWSAPYLVTDDTVPLTESRWTYQAGNANIRYLHHMITCLLNEMLKSSHIHVKYDKTRKVTQKRKKKGKNPALFLSWLTEAVQKYTNVDISTPAGLLYLHVSS